MDVVLFMNKQVHLSHAWCGVGAGEEKLKGQEIMTKGTVSAVRELGKNKAMLAFAALFLLAQPASAADIETQTGITIGKLRAVGNYNAGTLYDNTLEVWPNSPLPTSSICTVTSRFYINSAQTHMISAVLLAFAAGRKISVNLDPTLPVRNGACEASYVDVLAQ